LDASEFLSPAQVCKAIGLSPKALRLYEARGLVRPHRSAAGWRLFGRVELIRLHQIKTPKQLGLTLEQIGSLLEGRLANPAQFLEMQASLLSDQAQRIARAHALVRQTSNALSSGETPTIEAIIALCQESNVMTQQDWRQLAQPFYRKYTTDEERQIPVKVMTAPWDELYAEANRLYEARLEPQSEAVIAFARRWMDYVEVFIGENYDLGAKYSAAYKEALRDPEVAPHLPLSQEVVRFLGPAFGRVQSERKAIRSASR
jgi:MerR family transcriptional regulator, thiopeptide resistance regulator